MRACATINRAIPPPSNNGAADVSALANAVLLMAGQMREPSDEVRDQSEVRQMHEALKWR